MLPVPSLDELVEFTGRAKDTFRPFAVQALTQATLLFSLRTALTALPDDPGRAALARNAILQMADRIALEQPYSEDLAGPYQSETIGSYSYSKGATVNRVKDGADTGLYWWDLAMDLLTAEGESLVASGSIRAFEPLLAYDEHGHAALVTPADLDSGPQYRVISRN